MVRLLFALLFIAGCTQCRSGTVLLDMKLREGTDALEINLQLDTEPSQTHSRFPTGTHESLEITFARDYPVGSNLNVYVNATDGGNSVGDITRNITLTSGCTAVLLDFTQ